MPGRFKKPSPAMVVALIALFVALTGTGTAATIVLSRSSASATGTAYHGAVARALRAVHKSPQATAKLHRLLAQVGKPKRGPRGRRGPRGPAGPQGPAGLQGPPGPTGIATITFVEGPWSPQCPTGGGACQIATSTAVCPTGLRVVGGGFVSGSTDNIVLFAEAIGPGSGGYQVIAENVNNIPNNIKAQAICAGP
jgi:hypothetical protein